MNLARSNPKLRGKLLSATRPLWKPLRTLAGTILGTGTIALKQTVHDSGKTRILVVSAVQDGGLAKISKEIFSGLSEAFDIYFAHLNNFQITTKFQGQTIFSAKGNFLLDGSQNNSNFDEEFSNLLDIVNPEIIHLEHLNKISHAAIQQLDTDRFFISHTLHDYFDICPSHNLLDERLSFCGGICTKGSGWCDMSLILPGDINKIKNKFVHEWREINASLFEHVNVIISPSSYSAELFLNSYPTLIEKVKVIPHGVKEQPKQANIKPPRKLEKVLFLGNYLPSKGSKKIKGLARAGAKKNISFFHLGRAPIQFKRWAKLMGPYLESELRAILSEIDPDCVVVASIWPETFGLVVDEAAALGVPIISLVSGEVSDRVARENIGLVIDPTASPEAVLAEIQNFLLDPEAISKLTLGLSEFRAGLGSRHSTMINSYKVVFENA